MKSLDIQIVDSICEITESRLWALVNGGTPSILARPHVPPLETEAQASLFHNNPQYGLNVTPPCCHNYSLALQQRDTLGENGTHHAFQRFRYH